MRAGFPHSDTPGSKLACQLPGAYRRLPRPSSPVVAKASTTCTFSLDPITLSTVASTRSQGALGGAAVDKTATHISCNLLPSECGHLSQPHSICFFRIFKEQPKKTHRQIRRCVLGAEFLRKAGGANRDRTGDLLLAKQALSQLSYGPRAASRCCCSRGRSWWVWVDLNHRPHPYQGCALTN